MRGAAARQHLAIGTPTKTWARFTADCRTSTGSSIINRQVHCGLRHWRGSIDPIPDVGRPRRETRPTPSRHWPDGRYLGREAGQGVFISHWPPRTSAGVVPAAAGSAAPSDPSLLEAHRRTAHRTSGAGVGDRQVVYGRYLRSTGLGDNTRVYLQVNPPIGRLPADPNNRPAADARYEHHYRFEGSTE